MMSWLVWLVCCLPLGLGFWQAASGALGPDPGKALVLFAGIGALRLLLLTLAIASIARWLGPHWPWVRRGLRARRALGLAVFAYASCHLLLAVVFVLGTSWPAVSEAVLQKPYVLLGLAAWLMLTPLALTSTDGMVRRLGRRWKRLHRLIYPAAILVILHFVWLVRSDYGQPLFYGLVLFLLLADRFMHERKISAGSR
ncbi:MAG TPA: protein-methionine-sulfoxide reductase heme-binding subunit MsrQ [Spongiibacteraceae bacterium]|jgi:sulfoxide reductase heme-binding subunit YedZ|nr:protein-methionine-sulfoxide reductase heme-binding subunit MsrQ [Spongiibacteraceae bacterium]HUH38442.1 protein-methionine-sulfoxide reductase heme-binding subunit MsrQ [Spongiibacteraceae bacterium]